MKMDYFLHDASKMNVIINLLIFTISFVRCVTLENILCN